MTKKFKINLKNFITDFSGYKHAINFVGDPSKEQCLIILCEVIKCFKNKLHIFSKEKSFLQSIELVKKKNLLDEHYLNIYEKSRKGGIPTEEETAELYNSSKINLCIDTRLKPLTDIQVFEILASGGFLITNERADIGEYFEISRHLEIFSDTPDLIDKIEFYLKNLNIAQKIAQLGRFEIIKNYAISPKRKKPSKVKCSRNL